MKKLSKISFKKANFSDIEFLWYLRSQPDVYQYSRNNRAVNWREHVKWILPIILKTSNKDLFVIKESQTPIGQVRFDYNDKKEAEISISILNQFRGKGFATKSLKLAIARIKKQQKIQRLIATIHKKNPTSIKLFEKLNFSFKRKKGNWLKYCLEL